MAIVYSEVVSYLLIHISNQMFILHISLVADQLEGNQHRYAYYREKICDYMHANRADFEPFIVDESFDTFMRSLSKDGTYGGNECLVAFSRLFDARICIHQVIIILNETIDKKI